MFQIHEQYINLESGHHFIELRDGKNSHILQIDIGHGSCPACGTVHPKTELGAIDPKQAAASACASLDESIGGMLEYAAKHGLRVK